MKKIMGNLLLVLLVAFTMVTQGVSPAVAAPLVEIETVLIGSPENAADTAHGNPYGAVGYTYAIGKTEVTVEQYTAFLNAVDPTGANALGLYNSYMNPANDGDWSCGIVLDGSAAEGGKYSAASLAHAEKPVNYVSFWDAARFCNWLTNGQPTGAAATATALNTGVYNFPTGSGAGYVDGYAINPANKSVTRNADAWAGGGYAITSEDEWYKAAYYDTKGTETLDDDTYTLYATGDTITTGQANYAWSYDAEADSVGYLAPTGHYDEEQNGTFDMMGNVFEWNDTTIENNYRGLRGGSFAGLGGTLASSARGSGGYPDSEGSDFGFRVSSLAVPEPSTYGLIGGGMLLGIIMLRRRKNRVTL